MWVGTWTCVAPSNGATRTKETVWILVKPRFVAAVHGRSDLLATSVFRLALDELRERQRG